MTKPNQPDLEHLLVDHLPLLRTFVRLNIGRRFQGESDVDIVQTVCREILARGDTFEFRNAPAFKNWLITVALNKIRSRMRYNGGDCRNKAREVRIDELQDAGVLELYASIASPSQNAMRSELADRIELAFEQLPENYREIITLSRLAHMAHDEIAEHLDLSIDNVRARLSRALARLGTLIAHYKPGGQGNSEA